MNSYSIPICLTHRCNLNCIYCYQTHDSHHEMTLDTAKECIQYVFAHIPQEADIEFILFGGEPLLRFDLIKNIFDYAKKIDTSQKFCFFASTNGTLLTREMKQWFIEHKETFVLGLSLDGNKISQNINRPNSFDKIDIDFFRRTWPTQNIKMTVSEKTLSNYAEDVLYLHSLGFGINGGDICLGNYHLNDVSTLNILAAQLAKLIPYYIRQDAQYNALFDIDLALCSAPKIPFKKHCGIGDTLFFLDTDGIRYPCTMITPMSFKAKELEAISEVDYTNPRNFVDEKCESNCYLFPICKKCSAENLLKTGAYNCWDREKCEMLQLLAVTKSIIEMNRILLDKNSYEEVHLYYLIESIKNLQSRYSDKVALIASHMTEDEKQMYL